MAHLDKEGLEYLWGKLKVMFNSKANNNNPEIYGAINVKQSGNIFPSLYLEGSNSLIDIGGNAPIVITDGAIRFKSNWFEHESDGIGFGLYQPTNGDVAPAVFQYSNPFKYGMGKQIDGDFLARLKIQDANENDEATTLGQVQSLIAESGGVSEELQEEIDGKVSKAGDTMTGTLTVSTDTGNWRTKITSSNVHGEMKLDNGSYANTFHLDEHGFSTYNYSTDTDVKMYFNAETNVDGYRIMFMNNGDPEPIIVGDAENDYNAVTRRQLKAIKPSTVTVTLSSSGWSNNTQTVTVTGVSATETAQVIQPIPAIASQAAYIEAGIYASGQAANKVTFTCTTVPTSNLTVYVLIQTL